MTWAKLSDDFADDCWTLTDTAFRLHVEALCWNGRKLLDCRVPKDDLRRFAKHPEASQELVAVGWWTDDGDAFLIRHHADYQRLAEQVLVQQAKNRANGRKGGRPRLTPAGKTESVSEPLSQGDRTGQVQVRGQVSKRSTTPRSKPKLNGKYALSRFENQMIVAGAMKDRDMFDSAYRGLIDNEPRLDADVFAACMSLALETDAFLAKAGV